jgi:NADP-dependent 3-hydroxy acid dehydrogenase YdfG
MTGLKEAGCTLLPLDVTDAASIKGAVAQVLKAAGRIDVLVNMAGLSGRGAAAEYDLAQARRQFEVNLFGLMAMNQAVLPSMLQQGRGTIINVGSALGLLPVPFASVYCASKAAVRAMTDCMRMELAGRWRRRIFIGGGGGEAGSLGGWGVPAVPWRVGV